VESRRARHCSRGIANSWAEGNPFIYHLFTSYTVHHNLHHHIPNTVPYTAREPPIRFQQSIPPPERIPGISHFPGSNRTCRPCVPFFDYTCQAIKSEPQFRPREIQRSSEKLESNPQSSTRSSNHNSSSSSTSYPTWTIKKGKKRAV
jgi:hypothetical protein